MESLGVDANKEDCCTFLAEQLRLMCTAAKGRRYSIDIIIYSFSIFHKSPACCGELRKTLCLPSKELLRDISSNMCVDSGNVCQNYLKSRAGQLKPNELMVNIQLDEIHIKSKVVYDNGKVCGYAENKSLKETNRMQCFMLSSLFSDNRDVVQWWQKESGPSAILSKKEQSRVKRPNKSRKTVNLFLKYNMYK